ncbi:hypothetical protein [Streptomyces sp. NPDC002785]
MRPRRRALGVTQEDEVRGQDGRRPPATTPGHPVRHIPGAWESAG